MWLVIPEVERCGLFTPRVDELDTVLPGEMAALHFGQHVQPLQDPIGFRDQGFPDVKPGKMLPLEKLDLVTMLGDKRRCG